MTVMIVTLLRSLPLTKSYDCAVSELGSTERLRLANTDLKNSQNSSSQILQQGVNFKDFYYFIFFFLRN